MLLKELRQFVTECERFDEMCAFYGNNNILTVEECATVFQAGLNADNMYKINCDIVCGFLFSETLDFYLKRQVA